MFILYKGEKHPMLETMRDVFSRVRVTSTQRPLPSEAGAVIEQMLAPVLATSRMRPDDARVVSILAEFDANAWDNQAAERHHGREAFVRLRRWINHRFRRAQRASEWRMTLVDEVVVAQTATLLASLLIAPEDIWRLPKEGTPQLALV